MTSRTAFLASALGLLVTAGAWGCSRDDPAAAGPSLSADAGGSTGGVGVCRSACQGAIASRCPADSTSACEAQCATFFETRGGCPDSVTAFWKCVGAQPASSFQCSDDDHAELISGACKAEDTAIGNATCAGGGGTSGAGGAGSGGAGSAGAGTTLGETKCYDCAASECTDQLGACLANQKCLESIACIEACPASTADPLAPAADCLAKCPPRFKGTTEALLLSALGTCLDKQDDPGASCQAKCGAVTAGGSSGAGGASGAAYPSGPYGVVVGAVIKNQSLIGLTDPKSAGFKTLGNTTNISLGGFYNPTKDKSRPRVLRVIPALAWDAPAKQEGATAASEHAYWGPLGVEFLYALVESDTINKPATFADLEIWTKKYEIDFPSVLDPSPGVFAVYFSGPTDSLRNLVIDLTTMKIERAVVGGNDWGEDSKILYDALVKADTP